MEEKEIINKDAELEAQIKAEEEAAKEKPKKEKAKKETENKFIVRDDLGFKKRHFHTGSEMVILEAGKEVDEKTYNQFSDYCKKVFFK